MRTVLSCFILCSFATLPLSYLYAQQDYPAWTHFRGSDLDGISNETRLPLTWNDSTAVAWKTAIEGLGWSSPVVYGEQVWLTTATQEGYEMRAVCLDLQSGEILHNRIIFTPDTLYRKHDINSYATPTPAIEKDRVYVHFGRYGTACLNTASGDVLWKRSDLQCEHIQGPGSSLLIYKDRLIVHMEGSDVQYIVALDKQTGKTLWRADRPKEVYDSLEYIGKKAYITPLIVNVNGRDLMISNGSAACIAYDPETGEEIWRIVKGIDSTIAMPFEYNGVVYFYTGFYISEEGEKQADLLAVNPDGSSDIGTTNILWRLPSPILQLLTPVVYDGLIYTVDSKNYMQCIEASSGKVIWSERVKGKYNASPVCADGHLYFCSTRGETVVLKAGKVYDQVALNRLEGEIWATPAIAGGSILIRTSKFLYRIVRS
jgi:outer membrane protein assembly factor BamB